jgi:hypothetical protein
MLVQRHYPSNSLIPFETAEYTKGESAFEMHLVPTHKMAITREELARLTEPFPSTSFFVA